MSTQKPSNLRQRKGPVHPRARLQLVPPSDLPVPDAKWLKLSRDDWGRFWTQPQCALVTPASMPALVRLFSLRDDRERAMTAYRKQPLVMGSQNQEVLNPLVKQAAQWDTEIRQLEDRFGLNSQAALKVGLDLTRAEKTLEDLYADSDESSEDEDDPLAALVESGVDRGRKAAAEPRT